MSMNFIGGSLYVGMIWIYAYSFFSKIAFERAVFLLFLSDRGLSGAQLGIVQTALFTSNFLFELPSGFFSDCFGRRLAVISGLCCLGLGAVATYLWSSFEAIIVIFMLLGLGYALISGADESLIYDRLKSDGRESEYLRVTSQMLSIGAMALAGSMLIGGYLSEKSWLCVYLFTAGSMAIAAFCFWHIPSKSTTSRSYSKEKFEFYAAVDEIRSFINLSKSSGLLEMVLAIAILEAVVTPYFVYAQKLFDQFAISPGKIGIIYAVVELVSGIAVLATPRLSSQIGLARMIYPALVLTAGFISLNVLGSPTFSTLAFLIFMVIAQIVAASFNDFLHKRLPDSVRTTIISGYSFTRSAIVGVLYLTVGVLIESVGASMAFSYLGILPFISILLVTRAISKGVFRDGM